MLPPAALSRLAFRRLLVLVSHAYVDPLLILRTIEKLLANPHHTE